MFLLNEPCANSAYRKYVKASMKVTVRNRKKVKLGFHILCKTYQHAIDPSPSNN